MLFSAQVLAPYDSDQMYPVYGFGAKLRGPDGKNGPVSHCFPVYGGGLEVHGVEGILKVSSERAGSDLAPLIQPLNPVACLPRLKYITHHHHHRYHHHHHDHYHHHHRHDHHLHHHHHHQPNPTLPHPNPTLPQPCRPTTTACST